MWVLSPAALLLGTLAATPTPAAPPGALALTPQESPSAEALQASFIELQDEFQDAQDDFYASAEARWQKFQADAKEGEEFEMPPPIERDFFPRFDELAQAGHGEAGAWCIMAHEHSGLEGSAARADKMDRLVITLGSGVEDVMLQELSFFLSGEARKPYPGADASALLGPKTAFAFLELIHASSDSDEVKVMTLYARAEALEGDEASAWHQRAADSYPDTDMGQRCSGIVFEAKNLQIGQTAPDIVGKDHDGNDIRRSDFEGKVTVIDFWGFW